MSLNEETSFILKAETRLGLIIIAIGLILSIADITDLVLTGGILVLIFAPVIGVLVSTKCLIQENDRLWTEVAIALIAIIIAGMLISYF